MTDNPASALSRTRVYAAALAVAASVAITLFAFALTRHQDKVRIEAEFRQLAQHHATAAQDIINSDLGLLDAIAGLYAASERITRPMFSAFVHGAMAVSEEMQALAFIPRVANADRAALEQSARADGLSGFFIGEQNADKKLVPAGERPEYFPVYFVDDAHGDTGALGFDLASNPARRAALVRARDEGSPVATGVVELAQTRRGRFGFLIFRAIYATNAPTRTVEERRAGLVGFALGVFRVEDLIESAMHSEKQDGMDVVLIDETAPPSEQVVYAYHGGGNGPVDHPAAVSAGLQSDIALNLPGRTWVLRCTVKPSFVAARSGHAPWLILAAGLTMSLMLGLYLRMGLRTLAKTSAQAEKLAATEGELRDKMEQLEKAHLEAIEGEEVLEKILTGIKAGIVVIDPDDFTIAEINSVAEDIVGSDRGELTGKPWRDIGWRDPTGATLSESVLDEGLRPQRGEVRITHADGRTVPVDRTVITGYRGGKFLTFEIIFDISGRKSLERQLSTAQKLESVGLLAAGIAHEINTPIQYVGDNLQFLRTSFEDAMRLVAMARELAGAAPDTSADAAAALLAAIEEADLEFVGQEVPKALAQSLEGVERVAQIVRAMKRFAHPGATEKTAVDVNEAVENTVIVSRNEWKYAAEMETDLDRSLPLVYCLPGDFNQVLLNIIVNAAHAVAAKVKGTQEKGRIRVRTSREGDNLRLDISDTGTGIPEAHRGKIFDPFFTTKEVGKGTGQGLAIAHQIVVDKHGGSIDFQSEVGVGTTFTVHVPIDCRQKGECTS